MHDGSVVRFRKVAADYDPTNRRAAWNYLQEHSRNGEVPTGLLFLDESAAEMHAAAKTTSKPLSQVPYEELCPGGAALEKFQLGYR